VDSEDASHIEGSLLSFRAPLGSRFSAYGKKVHGYVLLIITTGLRIMLKDPGSARICSSGQRFLGRKRNFFILHES
jgi:hypothetical protein